MRRVFVWNQWNYQHIGEHGVTSDEAEYVIDHTVKHYPRKIGNRKYLVRGRTRQGRYLQVIFITLDDDEIDIELLSFVDRVLFESGNQVVYVIHARDFRPRRGG